MILVLVDSGLRLCSELQFLLFLVAGVILYIRVVKSIVFFILIVLVENSLNEHSWYCFIILQILLNTGVWGSLCKWCLLARTIYTVTTNTLHTTLLSRSSCFYFQIIAVNLTSCVHSFPVAFKLYLRRSLPETLKSKCSYLQLGFDTFFYFFLITVLKRTYPHQWCFLQGVYRTCYVRLWNYNGTGAYIIIRN